MIKYIVLLFVIILNFIYAENNTNRFQEYTFKYQKENYFDLSDNKSTNEVSIMIERRGLPLVNRLVRFISLKPDVFTFEINTNKNINNYDSVESKEEIENNQIIYTNVFVVATDENGIANAKLKLNDVGNGVLLMHILYVGSSGNTNISFEEFSYVNVENNNISSILFNGDVKKVNIKSSILMTLILFPSLFLASIALILISYFKSIYNEYRMTKSKIVMYTFFGINSIKKNFKLMIIIILMELIIVAGFILLNSYIFSVLLIAFFIAGFIVKREKIYSLSFFIFSCISMIYLYLQTFINYFGMDSIFNNPIMSNAIFIFLLFFIITSLSGGIYIPICLLVLYKNIFNISNLDLILSLIGIFSSSIFYILKVKKNIPFLFSINLLKIKDQ